VWRRERARERGDRPSTQEYPHPRHTQQLQTCVGRDGDDDRGDDDEDDDDDCNDDAPLPLPASCRGSYPPRS
jgi:hypothetical protein